MLNYKKKLAKKKGKFSGFTLIELVVGISIITIITGLTVANYHWTTSGVALQTEMHKLVADFKRAQIMALGSVEFGSSIPLGGWGISITKGTNLYYIFADVDGDKIYDQGEEWIAVNLSSPLIFKDIAANNNTITFVPPNPKVYINGFNSGTATITITNGTKDAEMAVNFLGLIDVISE